MKIALFAAVKEEVLKIHDQVFLTGIGRENATDSILKFIDKHKNENYTILNIGTVGAHTLPVGEIVRISEIVSGGSQFVEEPMLTHKLPITNDVPSARLFSSDCFVSPRVYSQEFLDGLRSKADCFDMESSAVFSIAKHYNIPFVSYKIVSDHLDVDLAEWQKRVHSLSDSLCDFALQMLNNIDNVELIY